jgi:hypothetical protein
MARGKQQDFKTEQAESDRSPAAAMARGMQAETDFERLLVRPIIKPSHIEDMLEHWDVSVKFDVKKIRSTDEFGESTFHWIEIYNVNGEAGWLYGKADYICFETKKYWIIVPLQALKDFVKANCIKEYREKEPYYLYKREGRKDKLMLIPTLDLAYLGTMRLKGLK